MRSICALMFAVAANAAWSQPATYPSKVVRVVNPVAPGGNQETIARTVADQLTKILGQPFVMESRPASSAIIGTRYVKGSPPDGYTLLAISNTFVRVPALMADPGDRKSTRLNSSHIPLSRMPSSA